MSTLNIFMKFQLSPMGYPVMFCSTRLNYFYYPDCGIFHDKLCFDKTQSTDILAPKIFNFSPLLLVNFPQNNVSTNCMSFVTVPGNAVLEIPHSSWNIMQMDAGLFTPSASNR